MKKKLKLRLWVKVVITLILVIVGFIIYHYLGIKGSYIGENRLTNIFIYLGWFWLVAGQIMVLYVMWEN